MVFLQKLYFLAICQDLDTSYDSLEEVPQLEPPLFVLVVFPPNDGCRDKVVLCSQHDWGFLVE